MIGCLQTDHFKPGLCECNEHRGTPRFRDEREEHKKAQGRVEMIGCLQTNHFKPELCECNEHRGTERFRDEREERKKSAVLGGK